MVEKLTQHLFVKFNALAIPCIYYYYKFYYTVLLDA